MPQHIGADVVVAQGQLLKRRNSIDLFAIVVVQVQTVYTSVSSGSWCLQFSTQAVTFATKRRIAIFVV